MMVMPAVCIPLHLCIRESKLQVLTPSQKPQRKHIVQEHEHVNTAT